VEIVANIGPIHNYLWEEIVADSGSRKHLIFPNSGILTKFQYSVTKGLTRNYLRGG
jgi:hypothetical protein